MELQQRALLLAAACEGGGEWHTYVDSGRSDIDVSGYRLRDGTVRSVAVKVRVDPDPFRPVYSGQADGDHREPIRGRQGSKPGWVNVYRGLYPGDAEPVTGVSVVIVESTGRWIWGAQRCPGSGDDAFVEKAIRMSGVAMMKAAALEEHADAPCLRCGEPSTLERQFVPPFMPRCARHEDRGGYVGALDPGYIWVQVLEGGSPRGFCIVPRGIFPSSVHVVEFLGGRWAGAQPTSRIVFCPSVWAKTIEEAREIAGEHPGIWANRDGGFVLAEVIDHDGDADEADDLRYLEVDDAFDGLGINLFLEPRYVMVPTELGTLQVVLALQGGIPLVSKDYHDRPRFQLGWYGAWGETPEEAAENFDPRLPGMWVDF